MEEKVCFRCKNSFPLEEMVKKSSSKDGRGSYCIPCNRGRHREWYEDHPEVSKAYRDSTAEDRKEYDKNRYEEKYDEIRRNQTEYYKENANKVMAQQQQALKDNPEKGLLKLAKKRAKDKGLPFSITEADIPVPKFCPVFGIKLEFGNMKLRDSSPSVDRFIPELGYVPGNVAVISWKANKIKSNASFQELKQIADWMESQLKEAA